MSPVNPPNEQLNSSQQLNQGGPHLGTVELNGGDSKIGGILELIDTNSLLVQTFVYFKHFLIKFVEFLQ